MYDTSNFMSFSIILLLILPSTFHTVASLESPEPEVLLQPRNFNPHPYTEGGRTPPTIDAYRRLSTAIPLDATRNGPVLFPANPEDAARNVNSPVTDRGHPYATVAKKQKIKLSGRFSVADQENNINPRVYSGLANYAAKVLKKPNTVTLDAYQPNSFVIPYSSVEDPSLAAHKKNYAFSYTVRDRATGDDFSHSQSQNAKATNGEYRVKLPDGRVQIVSYTADRNGYNAEVKYADDDEHVVPRQQIAPLPQVVQQPIHQPVQQGLLLNDYDDYYDEPQQVTQVEVPVYDENPTVYHKEAPKYSAEYVTIYPKLNDYKTIAHRKLSPPYVLADKVHIYPDADGGAGARIGVTNIQQSQLQHRVHPEKFVSTTLVPYTVTNLINDYDKNIIVSTVSPPRFVSTVGPPRYSQVYITTPKYTIAHGNSHIEEKHSDEYYKKKR